MEQISTIVDRVSSPDGQDLLQLTQEQARNLLAALDNAQCVLQTFVSNAQSRKLSASSAREQDVEILNLDGKIKMETDIPVKTTSPVQEKAEESAVTPEEDTDVAVAENWLVGGCACSCISVDDSEIEIDVAEDPLLSLGITAERNIHGNSAAERNGKPAAGGSPLAAQPNGNAADDVTVPLRLDHTDHWSVGDVGNDLGYAHELIGNGAAETPERYGKPAAATAEVRGLPPTTAAAQPNGNAADDDVTDPVRLDRTDHWPVGGVGKDHACEVCRARHRDFEKRHPAATYADNPHKKAKTTMMCDKCQVYLCCNNRKDCFKVYHTRVLFWVTTNKC